jgi:hypothetical protein
MSNALPDDLAHYVSLFGSNTPDEIEAQVFARMFPGKPSLKKSADKLSAVNVGMPGYGSLGATTYFDFSEKVDLRSFESRASNILYAFSSVAMATGIFSMLSSRV